MNIGPEIESLLIVKTSAVGDVIMTLPALEVLRKKYPGAKIDWLVEPPASGLLLDHPALNRVIISPLRQLGSLLRSGRFITANRLLGSFRRELRAREYEVVLDLQGLIKSAALVWQARGRRKAGFARTKELTGWALTEKMPAYNSERHAALRYLDAAVYLGGQWPDPLPEKYYEAPKTAVIEADTLLSPLWARAPDSQTNGGAVILNPGAKWATKRWPLKHWQILAARLVLETDLKLVITGGTEDEPLGRAINEAAGERALNLCGRTTLPVLAAVMAKAAMVVTGDTGPMHLAASVGATGLALFGPTNPRRTGPFGGRFRILTPPIDCQGCLKKHCTRPCLELLSPESVWECMVEILGGQPSSRGH